MEYNIGIVGAGTMGIGVASCLTLHDVKYILVDISDERLNYAKNEIEKYVRFSKLVDKSISSKEDVFTNSILTTDLKAVSECDIVIENIPEVWDLKKPLYHQLDNICNEKTIFAANTSCTSITKIASLTNRPQKVIGIHFMNPVVLMPTVEVIKGLLTDSQCIEYSLEFLKFINKNSIVVNDGIGFASNRISHVFMNEAAFTVYENIASPKDVDELFKQCFNHKIGPLETADIIGIDTVLNSLNVLYQDFQDSKYRACPLLKQMVQANRLGRKTGIGFYTYK
jgi:3-hydroxybutyryl-CoA dehydrogenase